MDQHFKRRVLASSTVEANPNDPLLVILQHHEQDLYEHADVIQSIKGQLELFMPDGSLLIFDTHDWRTYIISDDWRNITDEEYRRFFVIRLRYLRLFTTYTRIELSNRTGISRSIISDYDNGIKLPGYLALIKMAKAFNVSLDLFEVINLDD